MIFVARQMIEKAEEHNDALFILFVGVCRSSNWQHNHRQY